MDVNVGQYSDPPEINGLAHFCEHMLFLGTKKYPEENGYQKFLSEHAGSSNAFTAAENTNYYFEIASPHLQPALDRFAQFFISPMFSANSTDKELHAVDSEHKKNLQSDRWRFFQLLKTISDDSHPFHHFGTGDISTLKTTPEKKGISVREKLMQFHHDHYSANLMKLVVYGKESLDTLQDWVKGIFHEIPNKDYPRPKYQGTPFPPTRMEKTFFIQPVKDLRTMSLHWPMPSMRPFYKSQPVSMIAYLLGGEAKGTLLALLRARGWVDNLSAGPKVSSSDFSVFAISMDLTKKGIKHRDDIVKYVYQYIHLVEQEGVKEATWKEMVTVADIGFQFKEKSKPASYVSALAGRMHECEAPDLLEPPSRFSFNETLTRDMFKYLTVSNMNIHVSYKLPDPNVLSQEEFWYKIKYNTTAFTETQKHLWAPRNASRHDARLFVPKPNPYLPESLEIKSAEEGDINAGAAGNKNPAQKIHNTELSTVWHEKDNTYKVPKAYGNFDMYTAAAYASPEASVLSSLFCETVSLALREESYLAGVAGMGYDFFKTETGLYLAVFGYQDKLHVLLEDVLKTITPTNYNVTQDHFDIAVDKLTRTYKNFDKQAPYEHASYYLNLIVEKRRWPLATLREVLPKITIVQLREFVPKLFHSMFVESFIAGNVHKEDSVKMSKLVESILGYKPSPPVPKQKIMKLPAGKQYAYQISEANKANLNSATLNYYQVESSFSNDTKATLMPIVKVDLLATILSEPIFNILRTKQQLGYIVFSRPVRRIHVVNFQVTVQSAVKSAFHLDQAIEAVFTAYGHTLRNMTAGEFKNNVDSVRARILEKDVTLKEHVKRVWAEIDDHTFLFDRREQMVKLLDTVTHEDIIQFYDQLFDKQKKKISVQVYNSKFPLTKADKIEGMIPITDIDKFKAEAKWFDGE
eukprot:GFYU01005855.1.p1 GENE.GFYU01005855.1~~GFYU01005855.1.p1  ORF type:complete len:919 (-),score=364.90 GFYU01005855.1:59-2815(-)